MICAAAPSPVLKWPGQKWRLAPWIVEHLPPHRSYLEPFAGSLAVLYAKPRSRLETVSDLDGALVRFWQVLRDRPEDLAAAVELTPWARAEWEQSFEPAGEDIEAARRFLVRSHQSHGMRPRSRTGWRHATARYEQSGGGVRDVAGQWATLPPLLLAAAQRLRGVQLDCRPALDMIARFSGADCLIYCDPPYPRSTRGDWAYRCEMGDAEHVALLDALDVHPGPVLLSGYRCALYDGRLDRWARLERAAWAEQGRPRTESLWLNPEAVRRLGARQLTLLPDDGAPAAD